MTAMTCERFEMILPDYLEGDLSDEAKAAADAHAKTCESCAAIVADIGLITRDAAALPAMRPSRDLWSGIEERISAPVIPLAERARFGGRRFAAGWMAAAAAALVVTTAGITYLATSRMTTAPATRVATVAAKPVTATAEPGTIAATTAPSTVSAAPRTASVEPERRISTPSATLASNNEPRVPRATTAGGVSLGSPQADAAYAHEIDILERMVNDPRSKLDPTTVKIVKTNLQLIDDAIAQSKAALAKDPASPLLYNQMTRAMGKKVELLRTMASLSSSE